MPAKITDIRKHFWDGVQIGSQTECWPWMRRRFWTGYGVFFVNRRGRTASRFAYEFSIGPIPEGLRVLHTCDNRACCNPAHLFVGTARENTQDCISKGRFKIIPGSGNHNAKLDEQKVTEIRTLYQSGLSLGELSKRFNVSQSNIYRVVNRLMWRHVA